VAPASQIPRALVLPHAPAIAQPVAGNGDFGDAHQLLDALPARFVVSPLFFSSPTGSHQQKVSYFLCTSSDAKHQDQPLFLSISLAGISTQVTAIHQRRLQHLPCLQIHRVFFRLFCLQLARMSCGFISFPTFLLRMDIRA
jgi:hypothetical protein